MGEPLRKLPINENSPAPKIKIVRAYDATLRISRRYGGIYFKQGDLAGRQVGLLVGKQVWRKAKTSFHPYSSDGDGDGDDDDD